MNMRHLGWMILLLLPALAAAQTVNDSSLIVQTYLSGLDTPSGAAFLGNTHDALITQKNDGKVLLMRDRHIVGTALDLPVANDSERGLLSITLSPGFATDNLVYLYYTVAKKDGGAPIANRISRYRWTGSKLVLDRNVIDLPATPGPNHNGGKIAFDPKGKLLAVIGDLNRDELTTNFEKSKTLTATSAIIRIQPSGGVVPTNPFASGPRTAIDDIYAYGVRNSFGLAVDPVTGALWDTENGPSRMDEINQVSAGFNSGWQDIMGPRARNGGSPVLANLGAQSFYSDPEFSWATPVAPTDLHFFNSPRLGDSYRNDLFVGDANTGSLFHFDLTSNRRALSLGGSLADLVADNTPDDRLAEQSSVLFGDGFGIVSDIFTGPGGMYVLSLSDGKMYRITQALPGSAPIQLQSLRLTAVPEPSSALLLLITLPAFAHRRRPLRRSGNSASLR